MPIFDFRANGKIYSFRAPEGTDPQTLLPYVQEQVAKETKQSGFWKSFGEGATTLGSGLAAGKFGVTDTPEARRELIDAQTPENAKTSWADVKDIPSFINWGRQTAGTSMGYLAAPGAAGAVAQGLSKTPGVGKAVGLGMLGAQYLTENLGRQATEQEIAEQEGRPVKPASIGRAALAAAGQTGLDVVGFKFFEPAFKAMPFVGKLFGKEGAAAAKEAGDQLAEAIAKQSVKYGDNIAIGMGKGVVFEVPQEIAQQALERMQAGLSLNDENARREYGEAMAGAVLLGGGLGAVQGAVETMNAHEDSEGLYKQVELQRTQAARDARDAQRGIKGKLTTDEDGTPLVPPPAKKEAPPSPLEETLYAALVRRADGNGVYDSKDISKYLSETLKLPWTQLLPAYNSIRKRGWVSPSDKDNSIRKLLRQQTPPPPPDTGGLNGPIDDNIPDGVTDPKAATGAPPAAPVVDPAKEVEAVAEFITRTGNDSAIKISSELKIPLPRVAEIRKALAIKGITGKKPGKKGTTDAVNTDPVTSAVQPVAGATGAGTDLSAQQLASTDEAAAAPDTGGVDGTRDLAGESVEGAVGSDASLEAKSFRPNKPISAPSPPPPIPTLQISEEERAAIDAAPNVVENWPNQRFYEPKPKIKVDDESQTIINEIQSLRGRITDKPENTLPRVRLNAIEQKLSRNENLSPRDVEDLNKLMQRFAIEELEQGTPREDLLPLLDADERATGESRELVQDVSPYGEPVFKDGMPKLVPTPTKWAAVLKRMSGTENPLVKGLANLLSYAQAAHESSSEAELLPQDVEAVKQLQQQGKLLNTEAEAEAIRGRRHRTEKKDETGKVVLDEEGEPVTELAPFPKYGHPYLSKKHYNVAGRSADRTVRMIDAFRPNLILEGSEKFGNAEAVEQVRAKGRTAEYDPRTNTLTFTREGLTDKTILHELLHAFTVGALRQYELDPDKLTPEQHRAARQIVTVMNVAHKSGLAGRYPDAFENVYEFVSYAMTEPKFQEDLKKLKVPEVFTSVPKGTKSQIEKNRKSNWSGDFVDAAKNLWNVLTRAITRLLAPGIETDGNALLELSEAVGHILTTPKALKSKWGKGKQPLASARAQATVMPAPALQPRGYADARADSLLQMKERHQPFTVKQAVKFFLGTTQGYERLVKDLQNDRRPLKLLQDTLQMAGNLVVGKHNIFDALTLSTQVAHWAMNNYLMDPMNRVNSGVVDYANARGITAEEALAELDVFFVAEHEEERRREKFLRAVPLNHIDTFVIPMLGPDAHSAYDHRKRIYDKFLTDPTRPGTEEQRAAHEAKIRKLKRIVEELVSQYRDPEGKSDLVTLNADQKADAAALEIDSSLYDVIDMDPQELASIRKEYAGIRQSHGIIIDDIKEAMRDLSEQSIKLNKEANYWTQSVDNFQLFYGWDHYVPFKGKPGFKEDKADAMFERFTKKTGGGYEYVEAQEGFMGRKSKADNVILQTMVDGAKSALRYGRKDIAPMLKNLIDDKYINGQSNDRKKKGDKSHIISFADRYTAADLGNELVGDENSVFLYHENGDIEILTISPGDKQYREAIRRSYRDPAPIMNFMNSLTGFMGHMHTRYNPSFAPYNFVRDALTNAFKMGAEYAPKLALQYLHDITARTITGMGVARKISWLYHNGRMAEIEDMAKEGTRRGEYARDLLDYLKAGGRVAYIMGIAHKGQLNELIRDVNNTNLKKRWQAVSKYIDVWSDTFEFTARASAFSVFKNHYMSDTGGNLELKDAIQKAAADAKNLANFEQVGTYGREAGALFMFFRPAATGAVAALDSISQIWTSEQALLERLPNVLAQENNPARENILKKHREMKKNAYLMLGSIAGAGAMIYTMALLAAGDDDELDEAGRNKVWKDDPSMWTRNIRLPMALLNNESKAVIQIPWGFGLGAVGATGAQVAATVAGAQDMRGLLGNVWNITLDSFVPIPVSRINPIDNPGGWVVDSLMPSMIRPLVEFNMNLDGLGREVYNNRVTKYGDAALGRANVPEGYHKAARLLRDITNGEVNVQPGSMYFWANNYIDGVARITQSLYGLGLVAAGEKEFEAKSEIMLLSSFLGRESNYDARVFSDVQKKIEKKQAILNQFENNPAQYKRYLERDPYAEQAVYLFNKVNNSYLRDIRKVINRVKASNDYSPKQRKEIVDALNEEQNKIKRKLMAKLGQYGVEP